MLGGRKERHSNDEFLMKFDVGRGRVVIELLRRNTGDLFRMTRKVFTSPVAFKVDRFAVT